MRRFVIAAVLLLAGCSTDSNPPLADPATWKRFTPEQIARMHFQSRLPDVRIELETAEFEGKPEDMNLFYTANDMDKERWWKVQVRNGQTTMFSEREGWMGRKAMNKLGISPS